MESLGYVGEGRALRLGYLVATSRLLLRPLSAVVFAPSGSGKSELLDVVAQLLPPSAVEFLSRISQAALYYAGPDHLRHKLVVVDEQAGSAEADYAVRTLQSKGLLRLAVPLKGKTVHFVARGPIALMSGTTSSTLNPENLSRCLQLTLDDSPAQTRRIQAAQRAACTGKRRRRVDGQVWRDAQLVLEPLEVVIPYAELLRFPARSTHDRRGNQKLLGLIFAHALLHQQQRERDARARVVATVGDYAAIHALLAPSAAAEVAGLSPRAARAYRLLAAERGALTRRELAGREGWGYNTAKRALAELLSQELARVTEPGPPARYRLLDRSVLEAAGELLAPRELERLLKQQLEREQPQG
jgi:energy-coupling factor transporter ATP-binding protein EcfA2